MANAPLFPEIWSGSAPFVVLCEGDLTGYEAKLLSLWRVEQNPTPHGFDIRPCGTAEAIFGTADAIGRTVRLIVVEDRDFRSADRAMNECDMKCAKRDERNLAMRGWIAWSRNEIENYFLDDEVLFPAMREAFGCSDVDTKAARDEAIKALRVFQVVQAAASDAHVGWRALARAESPRETEDAWAELLELGFPGGGKPKWSSTGLEIREAPKVRSDLEGKIKGWQKKAYKNDSFQEPLLGKALLDAFDTRLKAWSADPLPDAIWKQEWAGKEVLKLVRQKLASKFSAPSESKQTRISTVDWFKVGDDILEADKSKKAKLQEQARDGLDRDIERAIQPLLIKHLWSHLKAAPAADMNADFEAIAKCFRL